MTPADIKALLAGYTTGTLNETERRALFEAALDDQELFDLLAKEEALREALEDPEARRQLIAALEPVREPYLARFWRWLRPPAGLAAAGVIALLVIGAGIMLLQQRHARRETIIAQAIMPRPPVILPSLPPAAAPPRIERKTRSVLKQPAPKIPRVEVPGTGTALPAAAPAPPPTETKEQVEVQAAPPPPPVQQAAPVMGFARSAVPMRRPFGRAMAGNLAGPAVDYTLLLRDAQGAYSAAPSGVTLHAGDAVRLRVTSPEDGYLYLFRQSPAGWDVIANQRVEPGRSYDLPADGIETDEPGQVKLLLALTHDASPAVDALTSDTRHSVRIMLNFSPVP